MADEKPITEDQQTEEQIEEELSDFEEGEKKKKKMMYIIIFVIQIIVGFVLIKFLIFPWYSNSNEEIDIDELEQEVLPEKKKVEIGTIYKLPTLTVNPKGSRGRRFAVIEIAFSVPEDFAVEDVKKYEPVLIDNFIQYFRSKTVEELSVDTVMSVLKDNVREITSDVVGEDKIQDIYFTNFILQ